VSEFPWRWITFLVVAFTCAATGVFPFLMYLDSEWRKWGQRARLDLPFLALWVAVMAPLLAWLVWNTFRSLGLFETVGIHV
jgi:hypothetical protein